MDTLSREDFNFELPEKHIAKFPLEQRHESKLLVYRNGKSQHHSFKNIDQFLDGGDLLVFNNAKVIPARLYFNRDTGAKVEILLLEPKQPANYEEVFNQRSQCVWKCMIGNGKKWKEAETLTLQLDDLTIKANWADKEARTVRLSWSNELSFDEVLKRIGEMPLPPYLNRDTEESDYNTYQTVFAEKQGSVAAPTAGLHFTDEVLGKLESIGIKQTGVTLHVGAGTFLPVKTNDVLAHEMHREYFEISKSALQNLIDNPSRICVGTTSLRVLESLYWTGVRLSNGSSQMNTTKLEPYETQTNLNYEESLKHIIDYMANTEVLLASTEIMILPHYKPRSIKALITNFHLPESTLLMLVASIVGYKWKTIYEEAKQNGYRFLSYGDSSLLFYN